MHTQIQGAAILQHFRYNNSIGPHIQVTSTGLLLPPQTKQHMFIYQTFPVVALPFESQHLSPEVFTLAALKNNINRRRCC
jgi:hypothetical protein